MLYSCAYFRNQDDSLETAQQEKMDLACRKLEIAAGRSRAGDRVRLGIVCDSRGAKLWCARDGGDDQPGAI